MWAYIVITHVLFARFEVDDAMAVLGIRGPKLGHYMEAPTVARGAYASSGAHLACRPVSHGPNSS